MILARNNFLDNFFDFPRFDTRLSRFPRFDLSRIANFDMECDIKETPTHFEIIANMPGFEKEDIKMELKDGILSIEAEKS